MNVDDMVLVSVDDHVVEPPDMFDGHLPDEVQGRRAEGRPDRRRRRRLGLRGRTILPNIGLNAVAGKPPEEYGIEPTSFAEMRKGC